MPAAIQAANRHATTPSCDDACFASTAKPTPGAKYATPATIAAANQRFDDDDSSFIMGESSYQETHLLRTDSSIRDRRQKPATNRQSNAHEYSLMLRVFPSGSLN